LIASETTSTATDRGLITMKKRRHQHQHQHAFTH